MSDPNRDVERDPLLCAWVKAAIDDAADRGLSEAELISVSLTVCCSMAVVSKVPLSELREVLDREYSATELANERRSFLPL